MFLCAGSLPIAACLAAADATHASLRDRVDGWGGDCWALLSLSSTGNSCPREASACCVFFFLTGTLFLTERNEHGVS